MEGVQSELPPPLPTVRTAPPTVPGPIPRPVRGGKWPTVIGILCLVFGGGGGLMSAWGAVQQVLMGHVAPMGQGEAMFAVMRKWTPSVVAVSAAGVAVAALLVIGGAFLLKRRAVGRIVLLGWAAARIVQGGVLVAITAMMQGESVAAMTPANAGGAVMPAALGTGMAIGTAVVLGAWVMALPLFIAIWFTRRRIVEQMRGWGNAGKPGAGAAGVVG